MAPAPCLLLFDLGARATGPGELERALEAEGARRLGPGVYRVASEAELHGLAPLIEQVRRSGGRVLVARVRDFAP